VQQHLHDRSGEWLLQRGCFRTLDEIAMWSVLDDAEKREVWRALRFAVPPPKENPDRGPAPMPSAEHRVATGYIADWYFDFVSPFAYLQSEQLATLAPRITIRYKPVLFAGILGAHGQKGPAEIPAKRAFTYRFVLWQAKRLGIPLKLPHEHPFNPLPLLRLAIACDCEGAAIHRIFRFVWRDGTIAGPAHRMGRTDARPGPSRCGRKNRRARVKETLRRHTDEAIALGVFGVPTLALRGELFWGADATQMAADYAAAGCCWPDPEYARAAALPSVRRAIRSRRGSVPERTLLSAVRGGHNASAPGIASVRLHRACGLRSRPRVCRPGM
jgi:2-hydroxychromene-2-carboxylate isomerase/predicted Fe-S protein YdhL (DUF1289 family)